MNHLIDRNKAVLELIHITYDERIELYERERERFKKVNIKKNGPRNKRKWNRPTLNLMTTLPGEKLQGAVHLFRMKKSTLQKTIAAFARDIIETLQIA